MNPLINTSGARSVVIQGMRHTVLNNIIFTGRDINGVLMNILVNTMKSQKMIELYEAHIENGKLKLINGVNTEPLRVAVTLNQNNIVCISKGYLSLENKVIDWNMVGAVGFNGDIKWTHPNLDLNLHTMKVRKTNSDYDTEKRVLKKKNKEDFLYKNVTEFKNWLSVGKVLKVVDWNGMRNRRGMYLHVKEIVKTKGFHVDAYFGNRKVGSDFINFLPSDCYEFKIGGFLTVSNPIDGQWSYALEPVEVR